MKKTVTEIFQAILVGFVMPVLLITLILLIAPTKVEGQQTNPTINTATKPPQPETQPPDEEITLPPMEITVIVDGLARSMELEAYILAVVLGEMPASFEMEALKAQAVVARTYTLKAVEEGKRHEIGAVCTKSSCCQAYCSPEDYLAKGGTSTDLEKVRNAVSDTAGQVLIYKGCIITATYFSCSGGSTEDAAAVWGYDVPYLQSVKSPGEEDASGYTKQVTITAEQFEKKMAVRLKGSPKSWFGNVTYTEGGGVATIEIGGVSYRGTTIRSLLGLRSTMFTIRAGDDTVTITTMGHGHRVGMSQYGADAMAVQGSTYEEILLHYYQGAQLEEYRNVAAE